MSLYKKTHKRLETKEFLNEIQSIDLNTESIGDNESGVILTKVKR